MAPGIQVYGEKFITKEGKEYRIWDPFRSKLAAVMIKGLKVLPIKTGSTVLYLGASTGTTASHISDIIGREGTVFCVEISPRIMSELLERCIDHRNNMIPILEDARRVESFQFLFGEIDTIYCDIAQPDQTDIAITNCKYHLKKGGDLLLLIKSRSIDVTKKPSEVYKEEEDKIKRSGLIVEQKIELRPFDKDHIFIHAVLP